MRNATRAERQAATPMLLYAIKQVELAVRARLETVVKSLGLTVAQYTALTVLRHRDDMATADLARRSFVTAQTMGELVVGLERRGLITRRADPAHGRRILITLTAAGAEVLARCDHAVSDIEEHMVSALNQRERQALRSYLNTCRMALAKPEQSAET